MTVPCLAPQDDPHYLDSVLAGTVMMGNNIPAHDQTFDLAELIAQALHAFRTYVAGVRDSGQADDALIELVDAIKSGTYDITRPKRKA